METLEPAQNHIQDHSRDPEHGPARGRQIILIPNDVSTAERQPRQPAELYGDETICLIDGFTQAIDSRRSNAAHTYLCYLRISGLCMGIMLMIIGFILITYIIFASVLYKK